MRNWNVDKLSPESVCRKCLVVTLCEHNEKAFCIFQNFLQKYSAMKIYAQLLIIPSNVSI